MLEGALEGVTAARGASAEVDANERLHELAPGRNASAGFLSRSALDQPFRVVAKAAGLQKRITPRAMRRTFQDLARAAAVSDVVTRAVSGHATEIMQRHYSTVSADEMRQSLARVVSLAQFRQIHEAEPQTPIAGCAREVKRKTPAEHLDSTGGFHTQIFGAGEGI